MESRTLHFNEFPKSILCMVKLENLCSIPSEVFFFLMENIVHIDLNQLLTDYLIKVIHTDL